MRQSLIENVFYMVIVKGIIDDFAIPAIFDELRLLKHPKLMRNGRFCHSQKYSDVTDAHLRLEKRA